MDLRKLFIFTLILTNVLIFTRFLDTDNQYVETDLEDRVNIILEQRMSGDQKLKNILSAERSSIIRALNYYKTSHLSEEDVLFQGNTRQFLLFMNQHEIAYTKAIYKFLYNSTILHFTYLYDGMLIIEHRNCLIIHKHQTDEVEIRNYLEEHEGKEVIELLPLEDFRWYYVETKQMNYTLIKNYFL